MHKIRDAGQAALHHGSDPVDPKVREVSGILFGGMGMLFGAFGRTPQVDCMQSPSDFGAKPCHPLWLTTLLFKQSSWPTTGP